MSSFLVVKSLVTLGNPVFQTFVTLEKDDYSKFLAEKRTRRSIIEEWVAYFYRWAQIVNPLISKANIFISGIAVPLMLKNVNGLVIEANFFYQFANPLEKSSCNRGFNKA